MARCLRPLTIKRPGYPDSPHNLPRYGRENLRPYLNDTVVVPCGKCLNCLKNRQSQMVVRCKREAEKRGTFVFMTLTYDEDHLSLVRSLWRVDKETGEQERMFEPEFVSSGFHPDKAYLDAFRFMVPSSDPRYLVTEWFSDDRYEYQIRVTPSVCRLDVRMWIKQARIQWKREHGEPLPDFSYVAISEYGPRTCRPHYHLAFFGLRQKHLYWLLDRWRFGNVKRVSMVMQTNVDGSSGFTRAAQYIGKYMSKGKFECPSVCELAAEKPRVCQSKGVGTSDLEPIRVQLFCYDLFGLYDLDTLRRPDGSLLERSKVERLVETILMCFFYFVCPASYNSDGILVQNEVRLPLPRIIRDKIFKRKTVSPPKYWTKEIFDHDGIPHKVTLVDEKLDKNEKTTSTTLWAMVTSSLRDKFAREGDERFAAFCASHPEREIAENCAEFAFFEEHCAALEEASLQQDFRDFYSQSQF